jgi:hypothetical protein
MIIGLTMNNARANCLIQTSQKLIVQSPRAKKGVNHRLGALLVLGILNNFLLFWCGGSGQKQRSADSV